MKYNFKNFTQKANDALNLAIAAAETMGHTYIGSEHLLLGLLREGTGVAAVVLNKYNVYAEDIAELMQEKIGTGAKTRLGLSSLLINSNPKIVFPLPGAATTWIFSLSINFSKLSSTLC
jgi:ATP-dependent Clp protease ATP-binding subunit ClpA